MTTISSSAKEKTIDTAEEVKDWFRNRQNVYSNTPEALVSQILGVSSVLKSALQNGNKILIFGNGGSAAEAQHFAAELVCQFEKRRRALPVIALTTDTSTITAQANDYGFGIVFARQIEALGSTGDVVIGLTTSDAHENEDHSKNILLGFKEAQSKGLVTVGLFSDKTKNLLELVEHPIVVHSTNTAIIQEVHLSVIHLLCRFIEKDF